MRIFTINEHGDDYCECMALLDTSSLTATFPGDEPVSLTDIEARILLELMRAEGRPVSKEHLINKVWDGYASNDSLAHRVASMRRKLGAGRIKTVYGYGYRLVI